MLSRFRKEINSFVSKVSKKEITTENTATSLEDLELILLQNDVALQTTQDLLSNLSNNIENKQVSRLDNLGGIIQTHFKNALFDLFDKSPLTYFPMKKSDVNNIFFKPSSNNFLAMIKLILEPFFKTFLLSFELIRSNFNFIGRL